MEFRQEIWNVRKLAYVFLEHRVDSSIGDTFALKRIRPALTEWKRDMNAGTPIFFTVIIKSYLQEYLVNEEELRLPPIPSPDLDLTQYILLLLAGVLISQDQ